MKLVMRRDVAAEAWNAFVCSSPQAWLFHTYEWVSHEASLTGATDVSFALEQNDEIVALAPAFVSRVGLGPFVETLVHDGLHRQTGFAFRANQDANSRKEIGRRLLQEMLRLAEEHQADRIHVGQQNLSDYSLSPEREEIPLAVTDFGFQLGIGFGPAGILPAPGIATTVVDQIVNLQQPEERLLANLKQVCRRNVRKAEDNGVVVEEATHDPKLVDRYYALAVRSAERTGESLASKEQYERLLSVFLPRGDVQALIVSLGGRDAAAGLFLEFKRKLYYFSGVSDADFHRYFVNDFLQWSAILHGCQSGLTHYRLGPIFPSVPRGWPIETVTRFKSKFGAQPYSIVQASYFRHPEKYTAIAQDYVSRLFEEPKN